jgi:hypothetical protein
MKHRRYRRRPSGRPAHLTVKQILAWADEWRQRTGKWPRATSGRIPGGLGLTWMAVNMALHQGHHGLPGRSSLARLLAARRGVRNIKELPPFTVRRILAWADAHHRRTGEWPTSFSGAIAGASGETWCAVNAALSHAGRGLPGRSSLAQLLARERGVPNIKNLPPLTIKRILAWVDAHRHRTGKWPSARSGALAEAPGETWVAVDRSLRVGQRGLAGGSSLACVLAERRDVPNRKRLPPFTVDLILAWTDAHRRRTGKWPKCRSGPIADCASTTWMAVERALAKGCRGFPGGGSLWQLLVKHGRINKRA